MSIDSPRNGPLANSSAAVSTPQSESLDPLQLSHRAAIQQIVDGRTIWDARILKVSDWMNPILVKETRQALKSRQFSITFVLMLLAVLIWTIFGITMMVPGIYFIPSGASLLLGYFLILMVPVCVIVPMSAFRSMASELEEGTHDVLSLSALSSRQIVVGKLYVAILQTIIYFSALTPCIALTYLLRGVGLGSILLVLSITAGMSLCFSTIAILLAALARGREQQVLMTLVLFLILFPLSFFWIGGAFELVRRTPPIESWEFFFSTVFVIVLGASYIWLCIVCAAARIGFASDNHSTRIRWILLFQHTFYMFSACFIIAWNSRVEVEIWYFFTSLLGIHWAISGALIMGERGTIAPRARRSLPVTTFGRAFFSWFNPGAGPGYIFVVTTYLSSVVFLLIAQNIDWSLSRDSDMGPIVFASAVGAYLAFYLGIARLVAILLRNNFRSRMIGAVALVVVLIVFGVAIPVSISYWETGFRSVEYRFYTFTNVFWTLILIAENDQIANIGVVSLICSAIVVFSTNLLLVTRDVMLVRIETPPKVLRETGELETQEENINPLAADN